MRAFVVDSGSVRHEVVDVNNSLTAFYEVIGCDCIDIIVRTVGGRRYNIVVDDEGLLKPNIVSGVCSNWDEVLAGVVMVFAIDPVDHDLRSIDSVDEAIIGDNIVTAIFSDLSAREVLRYQI